MLWKINVYHIQENYKENILFFKKTHKIRKIHLKRMTQLV